MERRRRLFNLTLAALAIGAALAVLALNPKVLTGFSDDRDHQPLLSESTLGPGASTAGSVVLTNEGVLPLRYDLRVTGPQVQADAGVVMRVRLNDDVNYVYQGPVLTRQPIPLGVLAPGQGVRVQVTLVARPAQSSSSVPVDDTFTWTAHTPGLETWWWLIALAAALAAAAVLLPLLLRLWAARTAGDRSAPADGRRERFWRLPLILAVLCLCLLFPLSGVSLAAVNVQNTNPDNLFATGTLVLSDATPGGLTCMSLAPTSAAAGAAPGRCPAIFQFTNGRPGDARSARVTIRNAGTVPVAHFALWAPAPCANSAISAVHGSADACELVAMAIHDDTHDVCYFPSRAAGGCALKQSATMAQFGRTYAPAAPLTLDPEGLGGGITFTFTVQVATAAGNADQGLAPYLDFQWMAASA